MLTISSYASSKYLEDLFQRKKIPIESTKEEQREKDAHHGLALYLLWLIHNPMSYNPLIFSQFTSVFYYTLKCTAVWGTERVQLNSVQEVTMYVPVIQKNPITLWNRSKCSSGHIQEHKLVIHSAMNATVSQYRDSFFKQSQNFTQTCKTSYRCAIVFRGKVAVRAKAGPHKLFKERELQHSLSLPLFLNRPSSSSVGNCFFPQITLIILLLWIKRHFLLYIHICYWYQLKVMAQTYSSQEVQILPDCSMHVPVATNLPVAGTFTKILWVIRTLSINQTARHPRESLCMCPDTTYILIKEGR